MKVLIIEDNPGDAALLDLMLRGCNFSDVSIVGTLSAGLASLQGAPGTTPDVVLLDLMLPDSRGLDSLRRVREAAPEVATVVLTGLEDNELALAAVREGAQDYFVKGKLGPEVLERCVRHAAERERIRRQVSERESLLRLAYEGVSVVPWDWDLNTDMVRVGAEMTPRTASGPSGAIAKVLGRVHPEDRARVEASAARCIALSDCERVEYRSLVSDGTYRWHLAVLQAKGKMGKPARKVLGVTLDVHRRRMAEDALRALSQSLADRSGQKFFEALVQYLTSVLGVRWAMIAQVEAGTPMAAKAVAVADGTVLMAPVTYELPGTPCAAVIANARCYIRDGAGKAYPHDRLLAEMGVESYSGIRIQDSKQRAIGLLAVMHDSPMPEDSEAILQTLLICATRVSAELERAETEKNLEASEASLRQAQKMEAIGKLASGIAHDFSNLLTAVRGHASLATSMLGPDHPALENLKQLEEAARQASGVASSLLTFARRSRPDIARVALMPILESSVTLFRSMSPPHVPLEVDIQGALGLVVDADETQARQLLINLLLNAADAVSVGGKISLSVQRDGAGEARIIVKDSGVGMPESVQARVFEPFFTTKANGSGLGLAVVHGVAIEHGWRITLESREGEGTTFTIAMPVFAIIAEPDDAASPGIWTGKRALLVMRSRLARGLVAGALTDSGVEVVQATDSRDAAEAIRPGERSFDLVVADASEEATSPTGIWTRVRQSHQSAKCILVGGPVDAGAVHPDLFVMKQPFQLIELRTALAILGRVTPATAGPEPGGPVSV